MKNIKKNQGFTLIEILVVIGIIAILATIVLIAINPARQFKQARDTQRVSNVNAILNGVGQYIADKKGVLPAGVPAAGASPVEITDALTTGLCAALVPTYLPSLPSDPSLTTGAMEDGQISATECAGTFATGYMISQDTNANGNRITISATPEVATSISVTR